MRLFNVEIPREIILAAFLISFLSQVPNIYAWINTPEGYYFSGFNSWVNSLDINTYFTTIRQGYEGSWLWRNLYTPHPSRAYPLFTFYLFLGHLSRIFHFSTPLVFHLGSFFLSLIFFLTLYYFIAVFIKERNRRVFCFLLITFGGGWGFLCPWSFPDLIYGEATVFQSLVLPHWILDLLLLILTILFGFRGVSERSWKWSFLAGLTGLILAAIHPYMLFVAGIVLGGYSVLSGFIHQKTRSRLFCLSPLLLVSLLVFPVYYNLLFRDPLLREWMRQQVIPSPPLPLLLLSYGFLSLFALFGLFYCWQKRSEKTLLLSSWFILHLGVVYLPVKFQLVMLKGFFIALCLLAVLGLQQFSLSRRTVSLILLSFFIAQPVGLLLRFASVGVQSRMVYLTVEEERAFSWLEKNTSSEAVVLSSFITGNYLPAQTGRRVFIGYAHWTPNFSEKYSEAYAFFKNQGGDREEDFLRSNGIDYVFYGPVEQKVGNPLFEEKTKLYKKVYENEKVKIFKVL